AASRLLHVPPAGPVVHRTFTELPDLLRSDDLLVLNETRVIPARLALVRETGGAVEALLTRPAPGGGWGAMLRPSKRLRAGEILRGASGDYSVTLRELTGGGEGVLDFGDASAESVMRRHGEVPLPPYVRRAATDEDRERYQTVFARVPGAIAAPTAGLHFDEDLLGRIRSRAGEPARVVLHVGPGTFRPLPDGDLADHRLDAERFEVPEETWERVQSTRESGGRVVAVGTTVVRALESRAAGAETETGLFIRPPYGFRVVDALVTNFHLPRSSLLCLVSALVGRERILDAYREAVRERYRFYSYGDATFLERPATVKSPAPPEGA
ncbi:MAG: tRNA preQ1(34) S-adenosylmethionine ribosyltransferase-isomerase QueA, partial [Gemmatimonadetes bacterium]|nr:tRNA preQ1(34) S-adenosylmethionine ribosyltransferase-isomerase QueA [Gemmatimonadota bacterium]